MHELGQLERHHEDLAKRGTQVVVVSNDDQETAQATQQDFPDLLVVSDPEQRVAKALQVIDPGHGPGGTDTNAPTTFLVDQKGTVKWYFRPDRFIVRLSPEDLLGAIDEHLPR